MNSKKRNRAFPTHQVRKRSATLPKGNDKSIISFLSGKSRERNEVMEELNSLMQNEYDAMSGMNAPMPKYLDEVLEIMRTKITGKEYMEIECSMYSSYIYAEKFGFEQGFMRGIAVAKGGAI